MCPVSLSQSSLKVLLKPPFYSRVRLRTVDEGVMSVQVSRAPSRVPVTTSGLEDGEATAKSDEVARLGGSPGNQNQTKWASRLALCPKGTSPGVALPPALKLGAQPSLGSLLLTPRGVGGKAGKRTLFGNWREKTFPLSFKV